MLSEEILKKVKRIELSTRKMVDDVMTGQYKSQFKGHGIQFSEHRVYMPGDDIRHIDWKVSARTRDPLIKKYEEERELTVLLVVDVSGSEGTGSAGKTKAEINAEIAGMLAYAATHTGDKVGMILFADEIEQVVPPQKGRNHVLRLIRDLIAFEPETQKTNLTLALDAAGRVLKHSGIVFVLSDFISKRSFEVPLTRLARKHDLVAIQISDEIENQIDLSGRILLTDAESGAEVVVDPHSYNFKKWFDEFRTQFNETTEGVFKRNKIENLKISTKEDYGEAVVRFFRARQRRQR